ncbi:PGF-CTERM sorting domain-containing protein [Halovivax limisalsi]|uniref:PGF-CTERM sorting domain-containing protein n=1 Tax=Halovivax limisalsi TaxID=1453760 RepID=UPI001FFD0BC5|nr:PGF-CTERM sorting domain-containing protein [Halovivax limisalsi]
MSAQSRFTTILIACMVALSLVTAAGPAAIAGEDSSPTQTIETLENGEDLYLAFGADLGDMSLDEYIEQHAGDGADGTGSGAQVIQYQDVDQVNVVEEGEAVSVAIGGGNAIAVQDVTQDNANTQDGSATAVSQPASSHESIFEGVDDVYLVVGNNGDNAYDGWAVAGDDGDVTASQTAVAGVTQNQSVEQANVAQNTTAFALAEDDSDATAVQYTEQANYNLQEGAANASNVLAADLDEDDDRHTKHKKGDRRGILVDQTANATIEQSQAVDQVNTFEQGAAVAIAVGEDSTAIAVQMTEQTNLNEQLATAEAVNAVMESAGMNVAMASIGASTPVVTQDAFEEAEPKEKKDGDHGDDVEQVAEASVVQYQSAQQANIHLNSSATAIATNGSTAEAVQLTFQQNVNAQVASADALNIFLEEGEELPKQKGHDGGDGMPEAGQNFTGATLTESTALTLGGEQLVDANRTTFDYEGPADQYNDVEQWSTAEVEQSQEVVQINFHSNNAIAVASDDGDASALQVTIQENENAQVANASATTYNEGQLDDGQAHEKKGDHEEPDEKKSHSSDSGAGTAQTGSDSVGSTTEAADAEPEANDGDDGMPGFGAAVALVALVASAAIAVRARP